MPFNIHYSDWNRLKTERQPPLPLQHSKCFVALKGIYRAFDCDTDHVGRLRGIINDMTIVSIHRIMTFQEENRVQRSTAVSQITTTDGREALKLP